MFPSRKLRVYASRSVQKKALILETINTVPVLSNFLYNKWTPTGTLLNSASH